MFLLGELYFGDAGGWLAAAAYLYAPYFAVDLYVRSAMEEFAVFPLFAFAFWGFGAYAKRHRPVYWLVGVSSYAVIMCCHFPAALLFTPLLIAFLGATAWIENSRSILWRQAAGWALALALSAFVWAPALFGEKNVAMNRAVEGHGRFADHLVYLHQLFYSPWGFGVSVPGPDDGMSFAIGWSHLLLASVADIWIYRRGKPHDLRLTQFFGAAAVLLCVLMLQDALWVWVHIPLLQFVLFPWRLLGPVALCVALLIAPLGRLLASVPGWRRLGMAAAMALLMVPNLSHLRARQLVDVDLTFWSPEQLSLRGFETTTGGEVTPRWMTGIPRYSPSVATVLSGDAEIRQPVREPFAWSSSILCKSATTLEMNTAWYPGWVVTVDGQFVRPGPGSPSGLITFQVPMGLHRVEVWYGRTVTEIASIVVSLLAFLLMVILSRSGSYLISTK
jgi:hypothetical protein